MCDGNDIEKDPTKDVVDELRAIGDFVLSLRRGEVRLESTVHSETDGAVLVVRERLVKKRGAARDTRTAPRRVYD